MVVPAFVVSGCSTLPQLGAQPRDDGAILADVSLNSSDVSKEGTFARYDGGDEVAGRVSLDLCNAQFASESQRRARHQVQVYSDAGSGWVSSEALIYTSPEAAGQAMTELSSAASDCPQPGSDSSSGSSDTQPVLLRSAATNDLTWTFQDPPDSDWPQVPGVERQAYQFAISDDFGDSFSYLSTYLRRGRVLVAVYVTPPGQQEDVIRNSPTAAHFIEVMSARLAALPESDVR